MKPLQVFLPFLGGGLGTPEAARDMARAVRAWDGEHRIWLLPGLERPVLWYETWHGNQAFLRAIPAEELNSVDVYHVGENGYAYGPPELDRFPEWCVDGLLEAWLSWVHGPTIRWQAPPKISLQVPVFLGDRVDYQPVDLGSHAGFPVPIVREGKVILQRPDRSTEPVSPEAELAEYCREILGELRRTEIDGVEVWLSDRDSNFSSYRAALRADAPLTGFFPTGVYLDALHHWVRMSSVVKQSATDVIAALRRATELSSQYVTDGFSTRAHTWFMPTLAEVRDIRTVIGRAATLGLNDARTGNQIRKSQRWRRLMTEPIPVRRAWGPIGLFWSLVLERMESLRLQVCERCGRPLAGTHRKRFCGQRDNPECFLARRAGDRRRERVVRRGGSPPP
jgi:hypothetical protein